MCNDVSKCIMSVLVSIFLFGIVRGVQLAYQVVVNMACCRE